MTATGSLVELQDIHLNLRSDAGTVNILKGINLNIRAGESVAVMGPSGSGKTTLMMLLGGLEKASSGVIRVAGEDLSPLNEDQLAGWRLKNVGIVFQNFHLVPSMTALENVAIPLEFARDREAFRKAEAALDQVGLSHRLRHYPSQLSGGEQQRVAIARAIVAGPRIVLADEPTGNLDTATGDKVVSLLMDLAGKNGSTLVIVTHDPALAQKCGRLVRINDGKIIDA